MVSPEVKYVELSFRPNIELVTVVRRFVRDFYERVLDREVLSDVALATHELLENAIKYSIDGETTIRIEVAERGDADEVSIRTRNRASAANIDVVRRLIHDLSEASDAMAFFQQMVEAATQRDDGSSGLGLARIWAEAGMRLDATLDGDLLQLAARTVIPHKKGA